MCNLELVDIEPVTAPRDRRTLKELLNDIHVHASEHATRILRTGIDASPVVKVMPIDYRKAWREWPRTDTGDRGVGSTEEVYR